MLHRVASTQTGLALRMPVSGSLRSEAGRELQDRDRQRVFNISHQVSGALAIAVFGALLSGHRGLADGLRLSLLIAAGVAGGDGAASALLRFDHRVICSTASAKSEGS